MAKQKYEKEIGLYVKVDGDLEKALKRFKKKIKKAGIMEELTNRKYYEKPSIKKHRKNKEQKYKFSKQKTDE